MSFPDDLQRPKRLNGDRSATPPGSAGSESIAEASPVGRISSATVLESVGDQGTIPIPPDFLRRHNIFVLQVKGNSMIEDNLFDGDHLIMEKRPTVRQGELVVAVTGKEVTLRRFHSQEGRIILESPNPSHKAIIFDENDVTIQGVVLGILRRYTGCS